MRRRSTAAERAQLAKPEMVGIIWTNSRRDEDGDYIMSLLAYHGGAGKVRSFPRDAYDPRAGENLPYFATAKELIAYWDAGNVGPNKAAQIPLWLAQKIDAL